MNNHILDKIDMRRLGSELQQARKRLGLTQEAAAQFINVARTTLTAIEKGERRITPGELTKLAEAYGRSVSDFVRPRPQLTPLSIQFRSSQQFTAEDDARIQESISQLEELCRNYLELEQIVGDILPRNYPPVYNYKGRETEQAAEGLAIAERLRLGLGDGPVPNLRDLLEQSAGLRIFYLPLQPSPRLSEIYFFEPELGGCLAINSHHPEGRRRWSLAHGYAHFLADRYKARVSFEDHYQRVPESERFADAFARYFLMPTNGLTQRFNALYQAKGRITPADLIELAFHYNVSFQALIYRLQDMRLIPSGTWERFQERPFSVAGAQKQLGLQRMKERDDVFPLRYKELALHAYREGMITEGRLAEFLQTDLLEARSMALESQSNEVGVNGYRVISQDILQLAAV